MFQLPSSEELTKIQNHILNIINSKNRIAVIGGPGTGKTVLAIIAMHRNRGGNMIITKSKPLQQGLSNFRIKAYTMDSFIWISIVYRWTDGDEDKARALTNYNGVKHSIDWNGIKHLYDNLPADKRDKYDSIFVDEGQDLPNEFYELITRMTDKIFVSFDEAQEVDGHADHRLDYQRNRILGVLGLQESFYDLIENFRNTKQIESVAKLFYGNYEKNDFSLKGLTSIRDGGLPKIYSGVSYRSVADEICREYKNHPCSVAILLPDHMHFELWENTMRESVQRNGIADKFFYKLNDHTNIDERNVMGSGIFMMTYRVGKGMEFDKVYLVDLENFSLHSETNKNSLYVACTRARDELSFVFISSDYRNSDVGKKLTENSSMFEEAKISKESDLLF